MTTRMHRQTEVTAWCIAAFGHHHATSLPPRALRFLEEAVELFQACGGDLDQAHKLLDFVFARPVGEIGQELGGVGVTLLALATAADYDADEEEEREVKRVTSKPLEQFRRRNEEKNAAGFAA
jgi:hypothetical protein